VVNTRGRLFERTGTLLAPEQFAERSSMSEPLYQILCTRLGSRTFSAIFENRIGDSCPTVSEANLLYEDFNSHSVTDPIR
jgi:hypothetical protein